MKLKELRKDDRPREKAKEFGICHLSDLELLAIILGSGSQKKNVLEMSNAILKMLDERSNITKLDLLEISGVGEVKALIVLALLELSKRFMVKKKSVLRFDEPKAIFFYLQKKYLNDIEHFVVLFFDKAGKYVTELATSNENYNRVSFDSKEIVRKAIKVDAYFVIIAHNHPSNENKPSKIDLETTKKLKNKLFLFNVILLDHIIFTSYDYYSFLEAKIL